VPNHPFQKPIVGRGDRQLYACRSTRTYYAEAGISEALPDGSKQVKVTGVVQTPWFGVNVGMNIVAVLTKSQGKIFFVAIDMLASPQELPAYVVCRTRSLEVSSVRIRLASQIYSFKHFKLAQMMTLPDVVCYFLIAANLYLFF